MTTSLFHSRSFSGVKNQIRRGFKQAHKIHTRTWQGLNISDQPAGRMVEIMNANIHVPQVPTSLERLRNDLGPAVNMPWADDHFEERVCGAPINPGIEWANWPDGQSAARFLDENGQFNHNYMERYWPKLAGYSSNSSRVAEDFKGNRAVHHDEPRWGIRWRYGDLDDLVDLLGWDPDTRQAYLPIFFPEDTGIGDGGRKPCTLGYHFILRNGKLHIYYPMRSCDFYRHWGDDVYLTIRLGMWILDKLQNHPMWAGVGVGSFTMHCTSLHMFLNDYHQMEADHGEQSA